MYQKRWTRGAFPPLVVKNVSTVFPHSDVRESRHDGPFHWMLVPFLNKMFSNNDTCRKHYWVQDWCARERSALFGRVLISLRQVKEQRLQMCFFFDRVYWNFEYNEFFIIQEKDRIHVEVIRSNCCSALSSIRGSMDDLCMTEGRRSAATIIKNTWNDSKK